MIPRGTALLGAQKTSSRKFAPKLAPKLSDGDSDVKIGSNNDNDSALTKDISYSAAVAPVVTSITPATQSNIQPAIATPPVNPQEEHITTFNASKLKTTVVVNNTALPTEGKRKTRRFGSSIPDNSSTVLDASDVAPNKGRTSKRARAAAPLPQLVTEPTSRRLTVYLKLQSTGDFGIGLCNIEGRAVISSVSHASSSSSRSGTSVVRPGDVIVAIENCDAGLCKYKKLIQVFRSKADAIKKKLASKPVAEAADALLTDIRPHNKAEAGAFVFGEDMLCVQLERSNTPSTSSLLDDISEVDFEDFV